MKVGLPSSSSESASQKKIGKLGELGDLSRELLLGNRVLNIATMAKGLEGGVVCRFCGGDMELTESFGDRSGMVSRITMQCKNRNCQTSIPLSNPESGEGINQFNTIWFVSQPPPYEQKKVSPLPS